MTQFKKQIEAAREQHLGERYDGDLADVLLAEPADRATVKRTRRVAAVLLGLAATVAIVVTVQVRREATDHAPPLARKQDEQTSHQTVVEKPADPQTSSVRKASSDSRRRLLVRRSTPAWSTKLGLLQASRSSLLTVGSVDRRVSQPGSSRVQTPLGVPVAKKRQSVAGDKPLPETARQRLQALITTGGSHVPKRRVSGSDRKLRRSSISLSDSSLSGSLSARLSRGSS